MAGPDAVKSFPVLFTERLSLRELGEEDLAGLFALYSDPAVTRFSEMVTLLEARQAGEVLRVFRAAWATGTGVRWAILRRTAPGLIGTCGLAWYPHNRSALLSYDLASAFWHQGFATEAVRAVVEYAFGQAGVNRITATTTLDNPASVSVLRRLGFQEEGILRAWAFWKGEFKDLRCFSRLRTDTPGRRGLPVP